MPRQEFIDLVLDLTAEVMEEKKTPLIVRMSGASIEVGNSVGFATDFEYAELEPEYLITPAQIRESIEFVAS